MSDLFNPYIEYLDLDTAPKCPTYYELLGISNSNECTHALVENGRVTSLAKIRAFKPGANAAVWAAVLDEVALASTTLLDSDLKTTYDNQLTAGEIPAKLDLVQRLGPIERIDAVSASSAESVSPVDSMAPSHLQSGAATSVRVAATQPVVPTAVAVPVAAPIATAAPVEVAIPIARTVPPLPDMAEPFEQSQSAGGFSGPQIRRKRRRSSRKTSSPLPLYAGIGLFLLIGGAAFVFWGFDNVSQADKTKHDLQRPSDSQLARNPPKPNIAGTPTKPASPNVDPPKPRLPATPLEEPLDPVPPEFGDPQNPKPNPPTDSGENTPPVEPMPEEPKPAPKPIEPAELVELSAALKLGRAALSDRNLDISSEQLAIAEPLARSGEPQKAFVRLKSMHEFLTQFMRLSNDAIDNYETGAVIEIGTSTKVSVVETPPLALTIHVAGSDKTYSRNGLPSGLAMGIANANFEESDYKSTLKAAFLITQKTLHDYEEEKAREFWKMGPESMELFEGYISDDYEFAPKPLEPTELVELSAALKLGRAALSDRNLDITAEQLAIAEPLARSGEPQKAFNRLKTMHEFMVQFMRLSNEAIDNYKSGSEIRISKSNTVVVVETTPLALTIHVAGEDKTYLRNELSTGLAIGIADQNFAESKYKSTLKAAFVITQKTLRDFEVTKAREFWEMGPESVELFEGYISDDYEFTAE